MVKWSGNEKVHLTALSAQQLQVQENKTIPLCNKVFSQSGSFI